MLLHAFSDCDTTSTIFQKKEKDLFLSTCLTNTVVRTFEDIAGTPGAIIEARKRFFATLHGGCERDPLQVLFNVAARKLKVQLATLPPKEDVAAQYSLQVHQFMFMGRILRKFMQVGWVPS